LLIVGKTSHPDPSTLAPVADSYFELVAQAPKIAKVYTNTQLHLKVQNYCQIVFAKNARDLHRVLAFVNGTQIANTEFVSIINQYPTISSWRSTEARRAATARNEELKELTAIVSEVKIRAKHSYLVPKKTIGRRKYQKGCKIEVRCIAVILRGR
jgi:hypothetical protein